MKKAKVGDIVHALGISATISRILYQEFWDRADCGWDIEFIDTKGKYRHWKQGLDGGYLEQPESLINCYGSNCSNLFQKYGYET